MNQVHQPVLLKEVISMLAPKPGQIIVDGTFGFGGHGLALAQAIGKSGRLIAIEQDQRTLKIVEAELKAWPQITLINNRFGSIKPILEDLNIKAVDGILLDLGISSYQLDTREYGLSFQGNEPLDMRLDLNATKTAYDYLRQLSRDELANILYGYADERSSRRIAEAIKSHLSVIRTTGDLARVIENIIGYSGKIHPATKTFQALRILVNDEFGQLETMLEAAPDCLKPLGRLAVISFHSGEDRIVKQAFKKSGWKQVNKKPLIPTQVEINNNPRSRSAKLRVAMKAE